MEDFLRRFGQFNERSGALEFSNVRAGLIVSLVSESLHDGQSHHVDRGILALYWDTDGSAYWCSNCR